MMQKVWNWFWPVIALLAVGWIFVLAHYRYNDSPSVKEGLYRITYGPYKRGGYVLLSMPMKEIAALPGDWVRFTSEGIYVRVHDSRGTYTEDNLLPNTAPELGEIHFPFVDMVVPKGQVVLVGEHPDSFDSRYFGPLPLSLITANLEPVSTK